MASDRDTNTDPDPSIDLGGPTVEDLEAIERERPLIEAELALLDIQIRYLNHTGDLTPLDWRRIRRAEQRVLREAFTFVVAEQQRRDDIATIEVTIDVAGEVAA